MNLTFSGGTTQQRDLATAAIDECVYPLVVVPANVTVEWVATMPVTVDSRHPYMATHIDTPGPGGTYHVYIMDWADDPTNPENSGLPHPADDIADYYKQSVVHEMGHIVCFETFDPGDTIFTATGLPTAPDVADACTCFFKLVNGARSYGTAAQWSEKSLAWGDEIRESVAEVFKVAFYSGRLIFGNRTNWKVDPTRWNRLMTHIPAPDTPGFPPGTAGPPTKTKQATASLKVIGMDLWGAGRAGGVEAYGQADPPYDETYVRLELLGSSGDASIELLSQDDGRYQVTFTLSGNVKTFDDAVRPVWLWLSSDFEAGQQRAKITSDAAGNSVIAHHDFHCGPQAACLFTSDMRIDSPTGVPLKLAVTDWLFSAPGQSPPNSLAEHFTETLGGLLFPVHTVHEDGADGSWGIGTGSGKLAPSASGPFGRRYPSPLPSPLGTVEVDIASVTPGTSPHMHIGHTPADTEVTTDDSVDDGPISAGRVQEEWWLFAVDIGFIVEKPALSSIAYAPDPGESQLNAAFILQCGEAQLGIEKTYGGGPDGPTFLPGFDAWYFNPGGDYGGVWVAGEDPEGFWFGLWVHWTPAGFERRAGLWAGEPVDPSSGPSIPLWDFVETGSFPIPGGSSGGGPPIFHATIQTNDQFGLLDSGGAGVGDPLFTWDILSYVTLERYRGKRYIELDTVTPTEGPAPVPQNPNAPGLTLVSAGAQQGGARTRTRPLSGVQAEAAKLVLT